VPLVIAELQEKTERQVPWVQLVRKVKKAQQEKGVNKVPLVLKVRMALKEYRV
jgi:hypothetical protein